MEIEIGPHLYQAINYFSLSTFIAAVALLIRAVNKPSGR